MKMNKLTKVGFSALCGSLAAVSTANAGDLTVTGGVDMSWVSLSNANTGNPIGIGSNLTFKGSGELDNGWKFDLSIANKNGNAYSAAVVNLDMGGLGSLNINQGDSGNGIAAIDDKMPTAWEEAWGAGLSTGIKTTVGVGGANHVAYTTPTVLGVTLEVAHAPQMSQSDTADKGAGGVATTTGAGWDGTVNVNPSLGTEILSGLNLYVGAHYTTHNPNSTYEADIYEGVAGITYDIGPISLGFGRSGFITGQENISAGHTHYKGGMYGIAFNVNDDLSISYGHHEMHQYDDQGSGRTDQWGDSLIEVNSWQVAYTMGGASMRIAETKGKNLYYTKGRDEDATTVSIALAF
jgi:hypothetical protein